MHKCCNVKLDLSKGVHFGPVASHVVHSHLENKVKCKEYKVDGEKGGKGFNCPSKKEEESCYF